MKCITYSFIIPHKNSPDLLERCISSIPERDDIEIIVVDDNSEICEKPKIHRRDVQVVLLDKEHCKGAGRARNVGLSLAKGKWLLFADCDDYYVNGFLDQLDEYVESDYDVIYFNYYQYFEGRDFPVYEKVSNYIKECAEGKRDVDHIKYRNNAPWDKMFNAKFVRDYKIKFEEIPIGNDKYFSFLVGYFCRKYLVVNKYLYNYIVYKNSLTRSGWDKEKIRAKVENAFKNRGFLEFINHPEWNHGFFYFVYSLIRMKNKVVALKLFYYYIFHKNELLEVRNFYPQMIMRHQEHLKMAGELVSAEL